MNRAVKKTEKLSDQEKERRSLIIEVRLLLYEKHYSERAIAKKMNVSRNTIRRMREGDIESLCKTSRNARSRLDPYATRMHQWILEEKTAREMHRLLREDLKVNIGYTQVSLYCSKLSEAFHLEKPQLIPYRTVSRQVILRHIWSDAPMDEIDWRDCCNRYPKLPSLKSITHHFRAAMTNKDANDFLDWMDENKSCQFSHICALIKGLYRDLDAVMQGIRSPFNNGFVEGTVNKLKMIKRVMYGRADYPLLRAKVILPYYYQMKGCNPAVFNH